MSDQACSWPPGYKFEPTHEELVVDYLLKKVHDLPPHLNIPEVTLHLYNPDDLTEAHSPIGDRVWYFFTPRERKYPQGKRPRRSAGDGFWKPTGADIVVQHERSVVGFRKTLKFYKGDHFKSSSTNWIMQEYRPAKEPSLPNPDSKEMTLDAWVLCKIYRNTNKNSQGRQVLGYMDSGSGVNNVPTRVPVPAAETVAAAAMEPLPPVNDIDSTFGTNTTDSFGGFTMMSSNGDGYSTSDSFQHLPGIHHEVEVVPMCAAPTPGRAAAEDLGYLTAVNYANVEPQMATDSHMQLPSIDQEHVEYELSEQDIKDLMLLLDVDSNDLLAPAGC